MKNTLLSIIIIFVLTVSICAENIVTVHYHRPEGDYSGWTLWSWGKNSGIGLELKPAGKDRFGQIYKMDLSKYNDNEYGLLPKYIDWKRKDDPDRFLKKDFGDEIYIVSMDKNLYNEKPDISPRIVKATLDSNKDVNIYLSHSIEKIDFKLDDIVVKDSNDKKLTLTDMKPLYKNGRIKIIQVKLKYPFALDKKIDGSAVIKGFREGQLVPGQIINDDYFYKDIKLGAIYSKDKTVFRTFSPMAVKVYINIYDNPDDRKADKHKMKSIGNGVWEVTVKKDLKNKYYKIHAIFVDDEFEVIDPYSKCNTSHFGYGMIIDDNTSISPSPVFAKEDAIIYEMHIRDFTIDKNSGIKNKGKYIGLTEKGTHLDGNKEISTGLSHLIDLGVNVVQIMPFQDFQNDETKDEYNWGYMPVLFNSPDGWYATKLDDTTRVKETKKMIDELHKNGIKVVLDVVYNHTAEGSPGVHYSFNGLAHNYYYRTRDDGSYYNGSGCGNEFRTESLMGRKFIIDSLKYWVKEYDMDGFRFDLMGLIDLETLTKVVKELKKIKPDILIYGEPWAGGETPIDQTTKGKQKNKGFGVFNDHFRDAVKGSTWEDEGKGYIQNGSEISRVKAGIIGSIRDFTAKPQETINYIAAHDNYTLWDKIRLSTEDMNIDELDKIAMDKLGAAIILTSQGLPFLQSGQEFLRTKQFEHNSYNKPDSINKIDWKLKEKYYNVYRYYKGLIALRKAHPMFRFKTAEQIKKNIFFLDDDMDYNLPNSVIAYIISKGDSDDDWENILLIYNPNGNTVNVDIPKSVWYPVTDKNIAGTKKISGPVKSDKVKVMSRSALIMYNKDKLFYKNVLTKFLSKKLPVKHTFSISAPGAKSVAIAGQFNGWNKDKDYLTNVGNDKWEITLELDKGTYEYKFIQDGEWDTLNPENRRVTISDKVGKGTLFVVEAPDANSVTIAGEFNDWKTDEFYLQKDTDDKWKIRLDLKPGTYEYKFLQDGDWDILNPSNRKIEVK